MAVFLYALTPSWQKAPMAFKTEMKIHFNDADPAGMAFSGGLFTKIHQCYENFIEALGEDPQEFFLKPEVIYPLRHFEGEYFRPLLPLQTYDIEIGSLKISQSSFTLQYDVKKDDQILAQFRSTHVAVQKTDFSKINLPEKLKSNLEKFVIQQ